ncbi:MAG: hypothetical protein ACP5OR_09300 [Candidatus Dormibacteria bacterium]
MEKRDGHILIGPASLRRYRYLDHTRAQFGDIFWNDPQFKSKGVGWTMLDGLPTTFSGTDHDVKRFLEDLKKTGRLSSCRRVWQFPLHACCTRIAVLKHAAIVTSILHDYEFESAFSEIPTERTSTAIQFFAKPGYRAAALTEIKAIMPELHRAIGINPVQKAETSLGR